MGGEMCTAKWVCCFNNHSVITDAVMLRRSTCSGSVCNIRCKRMLMHAEQLTLLHRVHISRVEKGSFSSSDYNKCKPPFLVPGSFFAWLYGLKHRGSYHYTTFPVQGQYTTLHCSDTTKNTCVIVES